MSHRNLCGTKPAQTVLVVICGAMDGDDTEALPAVYVIPMPAVSECGPDQIVVDDSDDYEYIDVEQCAKA